MIGGMETTRPAPGWYNNERGVVQWWDGNAWGPTAPPVQGDTRLPRRDVGIAYLFLILLGGIGAHRYYARRIGYAVVFTIFYVLLAISTIASLNEPRAMQGVFMTFGIPLAIMVFIDLFALPGVIRRENQRNGWPS